MSNFKYRAFISYSHADHTWGIWLHKALEKFKTPKPLVGRETAEGVVPKRLGRVYRDEAEEGAAHDLGERIENALATADTLIVLCSPAAANSKWVNQEIIRFKQLGRAHRIFSVILGGEPYAENSAQECFPGALKFELYENGELSTRHADPLAVDIRKFGRGDTILRLVAGILDIDYDELKQRNLISQRRELQRARALFATGLMLFVGACFGIALSVAQTWNVNTQRSLFFAEKAKQYNESGDYDRALLWALGGIPDGSQVVKGNFAQARAQFIRAYRKNLALEGHDSIVTSASFSPDGERVITSSSDGTFKIWDAATGTALSTIVGHEGKAVMSAMFSNNGELIATTSIDGTTRIWSAGSGTQIVELSGDGRIIRSAGFSLDSELFVTGSSDSTVKLWKPTNGEEVWSFSYPGGEVTSVSFSPDGEWILVAGQRGVVLLLDSKSGEPHPYFVIKHGDWISSANFSPDGSEIVTTTSDGEIKLWEANTSPNNKLRVSVSPDPPDDFCAKEFACEIRALTSKGPVSSASFFADGSRFVTASGDKVTVWDGKTGNEVGEFISGHLLPINTVAVSTDGTKLLTSSWDNTAKVLELDTGGELATFSEHTLAVNSAVFTSDSARVLTSSDDGTAILRDVESGSLPKTFGGHQGTITSAAISPDGKHIVTTCCDWVSNRNNVKIWDAETIKLLKFLDNEAPAYSVAFIPQSQRAVVGYGGGYVRLFNIETRDAVQTYQVHESGINYSAISHDGTRIVTASLDRTAKLWDAATGEVKKTFTGHSHRVNSAAFSPDNSKIITASSDSTVKIWDVVVEEQNVSVVTEFEGIVFSASFSPDGSRIMTAGEDGAAKLWDTATLQRIATLRGHRDWIRSASFSPDGRKLVTASEDGTAKLWDAMANQSSWSRREILQYGCKRIELNGLNIFEEASPILAGGAPDGSALTNPCNKRGLQSLAWWEPKLKKAYRAIQIRLPFFAKAAPLPAETDAAESESTSFVQ